MAQIVDLAVQDDVEILGWADSGPSAEWDARSSLRGEGQSPLEWIASGNLDRDQGKGKSRLQPSAEQWGRCAASQAGSQISDAAGHLDDCLPDGERTSRRCVRGR